MNPIARLAFLLPTTALALAGSAVSRPVQEESDVFNLGRNSQQEPCLATRGKDPAAPDVFDRSYFITCRSAAASRPVGVIRRVRADRLAPVEATLSCGAASTVAIAAGSASVRRCYDSVLATETVRIDLPVGRRVLVGSAAPGLLGPLEQGMAIFAGRMSADQNGSTVTSRIDVVALAPAPARGEGAQAATGDVALNPADALAQGVDYNQKGLNVEASRVLNDALSRLPADTPAETRAQLQLEAGLADSNISFATSAQEHFAAADQLIAQVRADTRSDLERKRDAYRALDLLNRRRFPQALAALEKLGAREATLGGPLADPDTLRRLNQTPRSTTDASSAVAAPDVQALSRDVLNAQTDWARSVALLATGDEAGARAAVDQASRTYGALATERIDPGQVLWLGARIERQRGRLAARAGDLAGAEAAFDRAIDLLRRGTLASAGTGTEPAIAEAQLERASIIAQATPGSDRARTEYAGAVDALIASNAFGGGLPNGIEGYFDLLVAEAEAPREDTYERFFRAMQATGEPAVARQLTQLQTVVTSDPALAALVRDRADVEREITRLRYAIAEPGEADAAGVTDAALERQRGEAEARLLDIDAKLSTNERFKAVDDRPATLAEIRAALQPGEGYYKLTELGRRSYGLFVTADRTFIFPIARTAKDVRDINALGAAVRASIDGQVVSRGKLVQFQEGPAYALFRLIAGPAADAMKGTRALVVDPAGPIAKLPIGVLVTDFDAKAKRPAGFDYSRTAFLARQTTISTAITPRSFLVARALPESTAARPFLGLGEHQRPGNQIAARGPVNVGFGCTVPFEDLARLSNEYEPISAKELTIAATALGMPDAPRITDAAFSDTAIEGRGDLAEYQVLHFATHGLEEGMWGCAKSPPALVTSFGDEDSDGLLSFSEIANLRLNANLVVLSACDTASGVKDEALARASGQEEAGSTLEGLVRAFLTANARAVLATYWQVSAEQESEDFIRTFYATARGATIGSALQAAQRGLIERPDYSHPFYWAPYFVVGDSTKAMLSTPAATPPAATATGAH